MNPTELAMLRALARFYRVADSLNYDPCRAADYARMSVDDGVKRWGSIYGELKTWMPNSQLMGYYEHYLRR